MLIQIAHRLTSVRSCWKVSMTFIVLHKKAIVCLVRLKSSDTPPHWMVGGLKNVAAGGGYAKPPQPVRNNNNKISAAGNLRPWKAPFDSK